MGGLLSAHEAELYIEHGSETPQDIVTGVTDMAKITVGASLRTSKADAATMFWKIVVNPGSTLEPPVDLSGTCTELHNDELWILAPLAYSAEAGLLETERDVDASGTPTTLRKLNPSERNAVSLSEPDPSFRRRQCPPPRGRLALQHRPYAAPLRHSAPANRLQPLQIRAHHAPA